MRAKEFIVETAMMDLSPQTIHKLADRKGVKWDNEPSFLQLTKRLTGKEHLDDLDHSGLNKVKRHLDGLQGVAEGQDDKAEAYRAHLIKTLPQIMKLFANIGKGWIPGKEQMLSAVDTAYIVMKHTGDVKQAGKVLMDELNTLYRMSQGKSGVAEEMQHKKITELFDAKTSFPLKWDTQFASSGEVHAEAYDADGRIIDISFTPTGYGSGIEIVFKRGGSYDMTGHGDAPRVLATVVNAISQYLQKYQPPYIAFSAKSTGGRAGAYAAMIRRLARGYKLLTPDEYPDDTTGFLDFLGSDKPFILARS